MLLLNKLVEPTGGGFEMLQVYTFETGLSTMYDIYIEPISKIRLVFKVQVELCEIPPPGARNGEKAEHTRSM